MTLRVSVLVIIRQHIICRKEIINHFTGHTRAKPRTSLGGTYFYLKCVRKMRAKNNRNYPILHRIILVAISEIEYSDDYRAIAPVQSFNYERFIFARLC